MSLTVFLAVSILACDVLIYFLYEWAFGESKRIRKRRARSRFAAVAGDVSDAKAGKDVLDTRVIPMNRQHSRPAAARTQPDLHQERLAYRRLAASYERVKRRA